MSTNSLTHSPNKPLRYLRYTYALFHGVMALLVILLLCNAFLFTIFRVDGHSMDPTLHDQEILAVCQICLKIQPPKLNDVVIVQYEGEQSVRFVKRIVGVPGSDHTLYDEPISLLEGQYYVEGDNRDYSTDSRVYGPISESQILGTVIFPTTSR